MVRDPSIDRLRFELTDNEVSLKHLLQSYGKQHPEILQLQAAVDTLKEKLDNAVVGIKAGIRAEFEVSKKKHEALSEVHF